MVPDSLELEIIFSTLNTAFPLSSLSSSSSKKYVFNINGKLSFNIPADRTESFSSFTKSQEIAGAVDYVTVFTYRIPNSRVMLVHPSLDGSIELLVSFVNAL